MVTASRRWNDRIHHRLGVWRWRLRYWWMDTRSGAYARATIFACAVLALLVQLVRMTLAAMPQGAL